MTRTPGHLERISAVLQEGGMTVELVEDGLLIQDRENRVALFAEPALTSGLIVRLHLDLELYVEEDSLPDILMGMNLLNQDLDYGSLNLDPVDTDEEDDEAPLTFAVVGRSVLWLTEVSPAELSRLKEHLRRFETEMVQAVEQALHGHKGISA